MIITLFERMENMDQNNKDQMTSKIPYVETSFYAIEKALLKIEGTKTSIKKNGKAIKYEIPLETKALYLLLTSYISYNYEEKDGKMIAFPGYKTLEEITTWKEYRIRKNMSILEDVGLIEIHKGRNNRNEYEIKTMRKSDIFFNEIDDNGKYVHQENKVVMNYIKNIAEIKQSHLEDIDPIMIAIMKSFKTTENDLAPELIKQLKDIVDSGIIRNGDLLNSADDVAGAGGTIQEYIDMIKQESITTKEAKEKAPLYNWLERDGDTDDQQNGARTKEII